MKAKALARRRQTWNRTAISTIKISAMRTKRRSSNGHDVSGLKQDPLALSPAAPNPAPYIFVSRKIAEYTVV
jgi:hypothetical protein